MNQFWKYRILIFIISLLVISESVFSQKKENLNPSWATIKKSGSGIITIYWHESKPFIFQDKNGELKGIEYKIMEGFAHYLSDSFHIKLEIIWEEVRSFEEAYSKIASNANASGIFGASAFSMTEDRRQQIGFSPPYISDIAVLISSADLPLFSSRDELNSYLSSMTAITIRGTLSESDLLALKKEVGIDFKIEYVEHSNDIANVISQRSRAFGYTDLPVYLMQFNNKTSTVKRQSVLTKKREGYGFIYPMNSDWAEPINAYFESKTYKKNRENLISNYINIDFYRFIERLAVSEDDEVSILTKEKEIQMKELGEQDVKISDEIRKRNFLILIITLFSALLIIIFFMYARIVRNNKILNVQKSQIEEQSHEIKTINENLELIVRERTKELEKKNKALEEYAFINAHKLRAPLASILGLLPIIKQMDLKKDERIVIDYLNESAEKLNSIVKSITDAIEKGD